MSSDALPLLSIRGVGKTYAQPVLAEIDLQLFGGEVLALTGELIGFPRHLSQHPGGFVISEQPLDTLVPVENASMAERTVIQWDKDDLDAVGLLKVDVLALGMLSALRRSPLLKQRTFLL